MSYAYPEPAARAMVVAYSCGDKTDLQRHESLTRHALAERIAALRESEFAGEFEPERQYAAPLYFVPNDTLTDFAHALKLGVQGEHDLFGGVVPAPFVATKCITHPLPHADARAPAGWSAQFANRVGGVVLPGFSAFSMEDAQRAGEHLLRHGGVRLKKSGGLGGTGQSVVTDTRELAIELEKIRAEGVLPEGVVLECNLQQVSTHSVGQARIGALLTSYCGTQHLTRNNRGDTVYGGSSLTLSRGNFDTLLRLGLEHQARTAIAQARIYHDAAVTSFPGMFASRCNYDIAQGVDDAGHWRSGVLEQSWRIGGASGAEIAALKAFRDDPALDVVCASTTEIYGANPDIPRDADIYCQTVDAWVGPITKFSRIYAYAHA